jgi:hypothetical protein
MSLKPVLIPSPERERWLDVHLPYRIRILCGLKIYKEQGGPKGPLLSVFPGIFESTLSTCRWASNFLGLYPWGNSLKQTAKRNFASDVFAVDLGGTLVDPAALSINEYALLFSVLKGANVASAHPVREGQHSMKWQDVDPAASLLIQKIETHVYGVLKLIVPTWKP